jgi:hypothetical protein
MYKTKNRSFIDLCVHGNATVDEIDDYIEKWHHSKEDINIISYLGMTKEEYDLFVRDPDALTLIIGARREKGRFEVVNEALA